MSLNALLMGTIGAQSWWKDWAVGRSDGGESCALTAGRRNGPSG
jgi:hypothetical protein